MREQYFNVRERTKYEVDAVIGGNKRAEMWRLVATSARKQIFYEWIVLQVHEWIKYEADIAIGGNNRT